MKIFPIKAFEDNYIWLIEKNNGVIIVDPGQSKDLLNYLRNKKPYGILLTHNHYDHTGGVMDIKKVYGDILVYGPEETSLINDVNLSDGDVFSLMGLNFSVMETSGHTHGHLSYLFDDNLFCGDALFMAGCGRVFTEDYQLAFNTIEKFKGLSDFIKVYPAHEYSLHNLDFSKKFMPSDRVDEEYRRVKALGKNNKVTLPTTIGLEKEINPFFRANDFKDFVRLRKERDNF